MNIERLLREEIESELEELKTIELGSEEHKSTVDNVVKLLDRSIELKRLDIDSTEKVETRMMETDFKAQQMEDEKKDRFVRNCIAVAGIVIPSVITIWGTVKSIEFEKEGTITTIMGRGFIQKLLPKK